MSEVAEAKGSWSFVCDNYGSATLMVSSGKGVSFNRIFRAVHGPPFKAASLVYSDTCRLCQLCQQKIIFCNRQNLSRQPWLWAKNPVGVLDLEFNSYFQCKVHTYYRQVLFPTLFQVGANFIFLPSQTPFPPFLLLQLLMVFFNGFTFL